MVASREILERVPAVSDHHLRLQAGQRAREASHRSRVETRRSGRTSGQTQCDIDLNVRRTVEQADESVPVRYPAEFVHQGPGEDLGSPSEGGRDDMQNVRSAFAPGERGQFARPHDAAHSARVQGNGANERRVHLRFI